MFNASNYVTYYLTDVNFPKIKDACKKKKKLEIVNIDKRFNKIVVNHKTYYYYYYFV